MVQVADQVTETKNSYHRADPAFTYLMALFLLLSGFAWGLAYADGFGRTIQIALIFVFGQFIGTTLLVSTIMFFLVGRALGKRRQGLFGAGNVGGEDALEFGYCFDVSLSLIIQTLLTVSGLDPSFLPSLGVSVCLAVSAHTSNRWRLHDLQLLWQHDVPACI